MNSKSFALSDCSSAPLGDDNTSLDDATELQHFMRHPSTSLRTLETHSMLLVLQIGTASDPGSWRACHASWAQRVPRAALGARSGRCWWTWRVACRAWAS